MLRDVVEVRKKSSLGLGQFRKVGRDRVPTSLSMLVVSQIRMLFSFIVLIKNNHRIGYTNNDIINISDIRIDRNFKRTDSLGH